MLHKLCETSISKIYSDENLQGKRQKSIFANRIINYHGINMKKTFVAIVLAACASVSVHAANTVENQSVPYVKQDNQRYTLQTGDLTMVVDAAAGGKILSFKYKDKEVISQSRWPETFGSTFWTSPQKEWNWPPVPEYDKQAYTVEEQGETLLLTSGVSPRLGYRISKSFAVDNKRHAFVITYSIKNESKDTRSVAPWEITRVPNEGLIFFDAPTESITPAGLMPFKSEYGISWYATDVANENRKVNADGKGWLAYINDGLLLVKKFQDLKAGQPAPEEAEIQVYVNRGKSYIELESQGTYTTLKPGESLQWSVKWYLLPYEKEATPSKKLLKDVRKAIKK